MDMEHTSFGYTYADVGAELARQWRFPLTFADAIKHFPDPLAHDPFDPVAALLHVAAWRARAEHNELSAEELAATVPAAVLSRLGLTADNLLSEMPPVAELAEGLDCLIS